MKGYFRFRRSFFLACAVSTLAIIFLLTSCENNIPDNSTSTGLTEGGVSVSETTTSLSILTQSNTNNSQVPFYEAALWGPVEVFKGYVEDLYINGKIGVGSVSYDIGESTEGTYIYALDVSNGEFIGDVRIPGRCYAIDIYGQYAFIWGKDSINVYDLNEKFAFVKSIDQSNIWISNFGSYFFVESRETPDYLIDKKTLKNVDLDISDDDLVYELLYPDCIICDPSVFTSDIKGEPAVYNLNEKKILGYIPPGCLSKIFAWDPQRNLFFCHYRDFIRIYDLTKEDFISELKLTQHTYPIDTDTKIFPPHYLGGGGRLHVTREFLSSENGFYFLNGEDSAYVLNSYGEIKCQLERSHIIGEFKGHTFFKKGESLGISQNDGATLWLKKRPEEPYHSYGPYFANGSIVWFCDSSGRRNPGDGIYQWDYETGSFLNYTEFPDYEIEILSSEPLILAMRDEEGGLNADWRLVCYSPSKLPFNFIPEISIDYSPDYNIYSGTTVVNYSCTVKDLPDEFKSQNILYEWDFGDGEKGSGKETIHTYERSGSYKVTVSVKIGDSADTSMESGQIEVLESPDIELVATPLFYSEDGLLYRLECKTRNPSEIGYVEWDFGDGSNGSEMLVNHAYKIGSYVVTATVYNYDKTTSWKKEIPIKSQYPEFLVSTSTLEGYTALTVDFDCSITSSGFTDSGLKYKWKIGSDILSEEKSFEKVFIDPGTYNVTLEVTDPAMKVVKEQSFKVAVWGPYLEFSDGGRKIESSCPIFIDKKYDVDKDGINQAWEDEAMRSVNPYFELDEEENWLQRQDTDKVVNFVRITPYPSESEPKYILFFYCTTWTRDYGRYLNRETIFEAHNGDVEKVVMAWKVIDKNNLELKYVYTSAHGSEVTSHSAVWNAKGETTNKGKVLAGPDETMTAALEFVDNIIRLQISEDKHAIYPTAKCGNHVTLILHVIGENCGGGGQYRFDCYNAGEPDAHLMDDINDIFPNESIWSGNKKLLGHFCGGLEASDNSPSTIGDNLSGVPSILKEKIDDDLEADND